MTLYLKYRPRNLEELDLKDVSLTFSKIVKSDNIPHAFLFAGPKGTGKTSAARILAKIINCVSKNAPCDKCDQCISIANGNNLDVIEMDAASNRGIDDVRSLRESIKLSPTLAKKKIYIIDEAHMLTTEASNALLKTLEEPPSHIIFILATTNPEKLIDTVKSRATLIKFRKATNEEIITSLRRVVAGEKLKISEATLEKIAKRANGAFRDAVKMLEQISFEGEDFVDKSNSDEVEFIKYLYNKEKDKALAFVDNNVEKGANIENLLKNTLSVIQSDIVNGNTNIIDLAELLIQSSILMKDSPIEELPLQIAIVKWCPTERDPDLQDSVNEEINIKEIPEIPQEVIKADFDNEEMWQKILSSIKPINASLEALLRSSKPINYDGVTLTLGVYYKFHKERLEDATHRRVVEDVITKVLNNQTKINCTLMNTPLVAPLTETKDTDIIRVAEEIFS